MRFDDPPPSVRDRDDERLDERQDRLRVVRVRAVAVGPIRDLVRGVLDLHRDAPLDAGLRRSRELGKPVAIGDDVWIGGAAIILPGVRIGDRAVIDAGSVVTRNIPDGALVAGNPCRVIRDLASPADRAELPG